MIYTDFTARQAPLCAYDHEWATMLFPGMFNCIKTGIRELHVCVKPFMRNGCDRHHQVGGYSCTTKQK